MRIVLIAVMLLIAILLLYDSAFGGPGGAKALLAERAEGVRADAERMDPSG